MAICAGPERTRVPLQWMSLSDVSIQKTGVDDMPHTRYGKIIQGHGREVRVVSLIVGPPLERVEYVLDRTVEIVVHLADSCCDGDTN